MGGRSRARGRRAGKRRHLGGMGRQEEVRGAENPLSQGTETRCRRPALRAGGGRRRRAPPNLARPHPIAQPPHPDPFPARLLVGHTHADQGAHRVDTLAKLLVLSVARDLGGQGEGVGPGGRGGRDGVQKQSRGSRYRCGAGGSAQPPPPAARARPAPVRARDRLGRCGRPLARSDPHRRPPRAGGSVSTANGGAAGGPPPPATPPLRPNGPTGPHARARRRGAGGGCVGFPPPGRPPEGWPTTIAGLSIRWQPQFGGRVAGGGSWRGRPPQPWPARVAGAGGAPPAANPARQSLRLVPNHLRARCRAARRQWGGGSTARHPRAPLPAASLNPPHLGAGDHQLHGLKHLVGRRHGD